MSDCARSSRSSGGGGGGALLAFSLRPTLSFDLRKNMRESCVSSIVIARCFAAKALSCPRQAMLWIGKSQAHGPGRMRHALNTLAGRLAVLQMVIYAALLPVLFTWLYAVAHSNEINTFTRHARAYSSALARKLELG